MQINKAKAVFATAKNKDNGKPLANNTRLMKRGESYAVRLHQTDIVTINPDGTHTLNSGGWRTMTTKARINEFGPVTITQSKGAWFVNYPGGECLYEDGMTIGADGVPTNPVPVDRDKKPAQKLTKLVKEYIDGFCEIVRTKRLERPSVGDCWHCSMTTENGQTMGDCFGDISHILSHFEEKYYVPSLLFNAIKEQGYTHPGVIWGMLENGNDSLARRVLRNYFKKRRQKLIDAIKGGAA
jgi:hypothetical protein